MTRLDYPVIMVNWTQEEIDRQFKEFTGAGDPDDPKERKRLRILEAATELFVKLGYRKTSIDDVARRAGVAKGTVYLYFKTKGDLLMQAVVQEKMRYASHFLPALTQEMEPKERLRIMLRLSFRLITEMPLIRRIMSGDREVLVALEEVSPEMRDKIPEIQQRSFIDLIAAVTAGHRWTEDETQDRAKVVIGLLYSAGFIADERVRAGLSVERFANILADLLTDGIA